MYVVSDWDRTLTRSRSRDNKDQSTYSLIFNGNYLPPEYNRQSSALFNTYRSSENSTELPEDRKSALMTEWWTRQFELFYTYELGTHTLQQMVASCTLQMRPGAWQFLNTLAQYKIPLFILSAGIQNFIEAYLKAHNALTENVTILSNTLVFDNRGIAVSCKTPLIHSLNKTGDRVLPYLQPGTHRRNLLLLGDTLEDARMSYGLPVDCRIATAFPPSDNPPPPCKYLSTYDALIPNDGPMDAVNTLLEKSLAT